jgi:hypothetical protein
MSDIIEKALSATRESKHIEFKAGFSATGSGEWCELIKDVVALANSGGGILVFGLDSLGRPTGESAEAIAAEDPADILNKLAKYIEAPSFDVESIALKKKGHKLHALLISGASIPHIFQKPGTYDAGAGKQKTAFGVGTIYFRHGAKSEHGNGHDLRLAVERELRAVRKAWVNGVRRVVRAPIGSEIIAVPRTGTPAMKSVRAVKDPTAQPVLLTRDSAKAGAVFYHEEISEGIFDEINNVVDANRALAKGQKRFCLGQAIYYRIYAERHHVNQEQRNIESLLHAAISEFYAPGLFWMLALPDKSVADAYLDLYRNPRSPQVQSLVRIAPILGEDFSRWLLDRFNKRWIRTTQPPSFYWTFKSTVEHADSTDYRLLAARMSAKSRGFTHLAEEMRVSELLDDPSRAASLASMVCMVAFEKTGEAEMRSTARNLDYLAYGSEIRKRATGISDSIQRAVGDEEVGEFKDTPNGEE